MPMISLDRLDAHPGNANRMPPALFDTLCAHLRDAGDYPPLIVRVHPDDASRYQVLDGHHRVKALRALGHRDARCEVWVADERRAAMLLLTLNRLQGVDDPSKRGALVRALAADRDLAALARLLPEDAERLRTLMAASDPPPPPIAPPAVSSMPHAVTFFLTGPQRTRLMRRLREVARDRSAALVALLRLDASTHDIADLESIHT